MSTTTITTTLTTTATTDHDKKQDQDELEIYDEIEIEDMTYDATLQIYHYPCPCGDRFEIGIDALRDGEEIAVCPSCSLMIRVVFEVDDLPKQDERGQGQRESKEA